MARYWELLGFVLVSSLAACVATNNMTCGMNETYCAPSNSCISVSEECVDGCPAHLQACDYVMAQASECVLMNRICSILANSPGDFTAVFVGQINRARCPCNHTFCPLTSECHEHGLSCDLTSESSAMKNISQTPWGTSCFSADHYFCDLLMRCVHINISCSYEVLHHWISSGNMTVGPYGTVCGAEEKYCLANRSCIPVNDTCEIMLPHSERFDVFCSPGERYCPASLTCVNESSYNIGCGPLASLDFSASNNSGTGWLPFCEIGRHICPRIQYGASQCFPLVENCSGNLGPGEGRAVCQEKFCPSLGLFIPNNQTCCPWNETFCPARNSCIGYEISREECHEVGCPAHLQACDYVMAQASECVQMNQICPILANSPGNFTALFVDQINRDRCPCNHTFCPLTSECHEHGLSCNLTSESSAMKNISQTPWGVDCSSADHYFCDLLMRCVHINISCSYEVLHQWISSGDMTVGPYGIGCGAEEKYCLANRSCIPVNDTCEIMLPHSERFDVFCSLGERYCPASLTCVNESSYNMSCVTLAPLNFSASNDIGTGWLPFCEIGRHICPRIQYGASQCFPLVENCSGNLGPGESRTSCQGQTYFCPSLGSFIPSSQTCCPYGTHFCQSENSSCIPDHRPCCMDNYEFCPATNSCMPYNETCCPIGTSVCVSENSSCIPDHRPCCMDNYEFCPATNSCMPYNGTCCPNGTYVCQSENSSCIPDHRPCCMDNYEFCPATNSCMPYNETCCPNGTSVCVSENSSCIPDHRPCCVDNYEFCPATNSCMPYNETCCPIGTSVCVSENSSCIPDHRPCCMDNYEFCSATNSCMPYNGTCCPNGTFVCESENSSCIPDHRPCCMDNYEFCPATNSCMPYNGTCCPNGTFVCESENSSCIPDHRPCCMDNYEFCSATNSCMPYNDTCCPNGTHFCETNGTCIPHHQLCCLVNETFCPARNHCIPSHEGCCPNGTHFCESNSSCIPQHQPCCLMNETFCPARNDCILVEDMCCPYGTHFCESNSSCIPHHRPCCLMNETFCPARNNCIPSHGGCCPNGTHFCESNSSCIPHHQPCCLVNETFCPARNNCIPSHTDCVLPPCDPSYPTVWKFVPLGQIRDIFKGDRVAAIAIQNARMFGVNGSLIVYIASEWMVVDNLSSVNAFVVGPANHIGFMPLSNLSVSHGVIIVNYTEYDDESSIGEFVDSSSLQRSPCETFAIFEFPKKIPPHLVNNGSVYSVAEDSEGDQGFYPSRKFEDISLKVPTHNRSIPASVREKLDPFILEIYDEELYWIKSMRPVLLYTGSLRDLNNPETGKWQILKNQSDPNWEDVDPTRPPPYIIERHQKLRFIPARNFNGNLSYEVVGGLAHDSDHASMDHSFNKFSPDVQRILKVLKRKGHFPGINMTLRSSLKLLAEANMLLLSNDLEPTEQNVSIVLERIDSENETITSIDVEEALYLFQKVLNTSLAVTVRIRVHYCPLIVIKVITPSHCIIIIIEKKVVYIDVEVRSVNDPPELKRPRTDLEPVPFNFTSCPGNGTRVGDIFVCGMSNQPLVTDVDTSCRDIGLAVLSVGNGSIGMWEYKMNETSSWTAFAITKDLNSVLLSPNARVRLNLHSCDTIWTSSQALSRGAFMSCKPWDRADDRTPGVHLLSDLRAGAVKSLSQKTLTVVILREGCDGNTDFPGRFDRCGVCRGNDRCLGCDDVPNSGAFINKCGFCVGGTTNRTLRQGIDCADQCGNSFVGACGTCQLPARFRNWTDCAGDCFGDAEINRCGSCAGGTTGRGRNFGEDACGTCGGDNSTCLDCEGVPNGGKAVDFCGTCLAPNDPNLNGGCIKLVNLMPVSGDITGETEITLRGAGFRNQSSAACRFVNSTGATFNPASITLMASDLKIIVTSPPLPTGQYCIECQFGGVGAWNKVENKTFTTYNGSSIVLSSISPNETQIGSAGSSFNVTITGSDFVDTGFLKCMLSTASKPPRLAHGYFVSSTEVLCTFSSVEKSILLDVKLLFGKDDPPVASVVTFLFFAVQPEALSIKFLRNPRNLLLTLDRPGRSRTQQPTCADFFDADAVQSFGMGSRCSPETTTKLIIKLGRGATIAPSQYVNFTNGSLLAIAQNHTKIISGYTSLQVESPLNPPQPEVIVFGQSIIGPCANLTIETVYFNDGGRDMTFVWYVKPQTGLDANTLADMAALNASLASETSDIVIIGDQFIERNVPYEIVVVASNFLGLSGEASWRVTRKQEEVPEIELNSAGGKLKVSERLRLQARALLIGCNSSSAGFLYDWSVLDSNGDLVDLGSGTDTKKSYIRFEASILEGGQNYTVVVLASDKTNPDIAAEKSIEIEVESSALIPDIRGGLSLDVGISDIIRLDARNSRDPDDSFEQLTYSWECYDSDNFPCFETFPNGSETRLILPDQQVVTKAVAAFLDVNQTYSIILTIRKGLRSATRSIEVRVGACSPPRIDIEPQEFSKINPQEIVSIVAEVEVEARAATITWTAVSENDLGLVYDLQDISFVPTSFQVQGDQGLIFGQANLILKPNSLEPGTYKFMIDVDTGSCNAYSETEIVINSAPSAGVLTVTPSSGTALDTEFTFTADGFTDDPDDVPLLYKFSYFEVDEDGKEFEFSVTKKNEKKRKTGIQLPPGDANNNYTLRVIVEVYDIHGAVVKSETNVTVNPVVLTVVSVSALGDSVVLLGENEDIESLLGFIGPIVSAFGSLSLSISVEVQEKVRVVREQCVLGTLSVLDAVADDPQGRNDIYTTMAEATRGGSAMSDETKNNFFITIIRIEVIVEAQRRRRRSVDLDSVLQIDGYTAAQAETTLRSPSNLLTPSAYTQAESTRKADFLTLVDTMGQKMCAYLSFGFLPSVAVNPLAVLRADAKNFDNADTEFIDMACSDCPSVLTNTAKMLLGNSLKEQFTNWNCTSSETCTWACVLSSQFPFDLLLNETSNSSLTDVVDLKIYNPETHRKVVITTLSSPVNFWIPLKTNVTFPNASSVECKLWNAGLKMWSTTGCVTRPTPIVSGNTTYVECNCTELGYVSVFVGELFSVTTQAPVTNATSTSTTAPSPTTTAVLAPTEGVNVEYSFTGDFDNAVRQAGNIDNLTSIMKTSTASKIGRNESNLRNFTVSKGSVVVKFVLIPNAGESATNFNNSLTALKNQVTSGNFQITLPGGLVLTADSSSFKTSPVITTTPTAAPTKVQPTEGSGGLSTTTIIIISVVCGVVLLIIIIIILVCCCIKKREQGKISPIHSPEPRDNNLEMGQQGQYTRHQEPLGGSNEAYA